VVAPALDPAATFHVAPADGVTITDVVRGGPDWSTVAVLTVQVAPTATPGARHLGAYNPGGAWNPSGGGGGICVGCLQVT
jgi:hypothetical protein